MPRLPTRPRRALSPEEQAWVLLRMDLVDPIARSARRHAPSSTPLDDLVQAGCVGLLTAAVSWDRKRDPDVWARLHIRYAIVAEIAGKRVRDGIPEGWWWREI